MEEFDKWQTTTSGGLLSQSIAYRNTQGPEGFSRSASRYNLEGRRKPYRRLLAQSKGILKGKTLQNYLYTLQKFNTFLLCREWRDFPDLTALSLQIKNWVHALKTQVAKEHVVLRQQQKGYLLSTILFAPFKTLLYPSEYMNLFVLHVLNSGFVLGLHNIILNYKPLVFYHYIIVICRRTTK